MCAIITKHTEHNYLSIVYRYIGPLRDEAASWAEKLKEVAEVLELWLEVQDLWQYLEAVFSNQVAARVTLVFIY